MILTGNEIVRMRNGGKITITPFCPEQINPNSYNYRLGATLGVPVVDDSGVYKFVFQDIPEDGVVLMPHTTYLGHTYEVLGSNTFAMSLIGRSSMGRLGLFLQVSANLGHTGSCHNWTLEMVSVKPIRIYPHMKIGQISFWMNYGTPDPYTGGYSEYSLPQESYLPFA